jgi:ankyrin repeat protein
MNAADEFIEAIECSQLDRAQLLISSGALNVNAPLSMPRDRRRTMPPLVVAAMHGQKTIVEQLLKMGAQIDNVDSVGRTACHHAVKHINVLEVLLAHTPKPDFTLRDFLVALFSKMLWRAGKSAPRCC